MWCSWQRVVLRFTEWCFDYGLPTFPIPFICLSHIEWGGFRRHSLYLEYFCQNHLFFCFLTIAQRHKQGLESLPESLHAGAPASLQIWHDFFLNQWLHLYFIFLLYLDKLSPGFSFPSWSALQPRPCGLKFASNNSLCNQKKKLISTWYIIYR